MSTRCFSCRSKIGLLEFVCNFCKQKFCTHHRLPEDHICPNLEAAKNKHKELNTKNLLESVCVSSKNKAI